AFGAASPFGSFGTTPSSALELLNELAGPVEAVGDDTIAGNHATHYRASLKTHDGDQPLDVWIDDHDRVVKLQASLPGENHALTMEITEFGVPVDVVAPSQDEVTSLFGDR